MNFHLVYIFDAYKSLIFNGLAKNFLVKGKRDHKEVKRKLKDFLVKNTYKRFYVVNIDGITDEKLANGDI
jgi:hypothetical protein